MNHTSNGPTPSPADLEPVDITGTEFANQKFGTDKPTKIEIVGIAFEPGEELLAQTAEAVKLNNAAVDSEGPVKDDAK